MQLSSISASVVSSPAATLQPFAHSQQATKLNQVLGNLESRRIVRAGLAVRESIETLQATLAARSGSQIETGAALARSAQSFSLDPQATAATLTSTDEVNAETTDYAPANPIWSGPSNADPVLSGLYDGAQGTGVLTFTVTDSGRRGANSAEVRVTGPLDELVADIYIDRSDPVEQTYDLGNGLSVSFAGNQWVNGGTAVVNLATDVDQQLEPDTAFNADPNFEYGVSVVAGSFEVNGETISVAADDTLQGVLDAINASAAGVFAAYDSGTQVVTLTQETTGASPTIVVGNDSSGFLTATKLISATVNPGADPDSDSPIALVPNLSAVTAGELLVNGTSITLDPNTQSVQDVVTAINNANVGAYARLVRASFLLVNATDGGSLALDSNGTSFFEALNVASDVYTGQQGRNGDTSKQLLRVYQDTRDLTQSLNTLFDVPDFAPQSSALQSLREATATLIEDSLSDLRRLGVNLRLRVDNEPQTLELKLTGSSQSFRNAIRGHLDQLRDEFIGTDSGRRGGLLDQLMQSLDTSVFDNARTGSLIDTIV